jgi:trk system potassium uptake protein
MSLAFIALMITEKHDFYRLFFETMSAFGNGGLSTGITSVLTPAGKVIISITMIMGKIGPLALGYSLIGGSAKTHLEYPEAEIIVG